MVCCCAALLACVAQAKNTYSVFSIGRALPTSSAATTPTGDKKLDKGWEGGWTFFGLPFAKSSALSGLAFGGKISYDSWKRDSTMSALNFLGTQGIMRFFIPIKPLDLFVQAGAGMFIGEHGFTDPDTLKGFPPPTERIVTKGNKYTGISLNIGIDWDIIEVTPGWTMVFTKGNPSAWFSLNAAMKF
jgi:hypothetical protein